MFYDTANRAAGKQCFHLFCISSRSQSNVWICMSTHLENWDWVILNQQEVEQLVPDFKKYKMDSMFILLPQGITIELVGVKHWRHSCFFKKIKIKKTHICCWMRTFFLYQWHWTTKSTTTIISSGIASPFKVIFFPLNIFTTSTAKKLKWLQVQTNSLAVWLVSQPSVIQKPFWEKKKETKRNTWRNNVTNLKLQEIVFYPPPVPVSNPESCQKTQVPSSVWNKVLKR